MQCIVERIFCHFGQIGRRVCVFGRTAQLRTIDGLTLPNANQGVGNCSSNAVLVKVNFVDVETFDNANRTIGVDEPRRQVVKDSRVVLKSSHQNIIDSSIRSHRLRRNTSSKIRGAQQFSLQFCIVVIFCCYIFQKEKFSKRKEKQIEFSFQMCLLAFEEK